MCPPLQSPVETKRNNKQCRQQTRPSISSTNKTRTTAGWSNLISLWGKTAINGNSIHWANSLQLDFWSIWLIMFRPGFYVSHATYPTVHSPQLHWPPQTVTNGLDGWADVCVYGVEGVLLSLPPKTKLRHQSLQYHDSFFSSEAWIPRQWQYSLRQPLVLLFMKNGF